ncbi:hypothetical protein Hanom_Chr12g01122031 [Helianthus anomalus]
MSLREFIVHNDLYLMEETNTPLQQGRPCGPRLTLVKFWQVIGWGRFRRSKSRVSHIRDLLVPLPTQTYCQIYCTTRA